LPRDERRDRVKIRSAAPEARHPRIGNRDPVATVGQSVRSPLTQNQHDAVVSFVFSIGDPYFIGSTTLRKLNASDYSSA